MDPISTSDLLAAINDLGREQPKRPEGTGWRTVFDMAKEVGISRGAMHQRLRVALDRGLQVETFVGSDYDAASGKLVKQTWFRVKPA